MRSWLVKFLHENTEILDITYEPIKSQEELRKLTKDSKIYQDIKKTKYGKIYEPNFIKEFKWEKIFYNNDYVGLVAIGDLDEKKCNGLNLEYNGKSKSIEFIEILPKYRKLGIASKVIKDKISEINSKGNFSIYVRADNDHLLKNFYPRLGFSPIEGNESSNRFMILK